MRLMGWIQIRTLDRRLRRYTLAAALASLVVDPPVVAQQGSEPKDISKREVVKVRLVTLDVLVTDSKGRTVPGLSPADFRLIVDGKKVPVDTLDEYCPSGALERPRGGKTMAWTEPEDTSAEPRRVMFVFDYLHLPYIKTDTGSPMMAHTLALKQLARTLRALPPGNEEILVAVLDGGVRIEQSFTSDRAETLATLARMEKDVTLYAGHFDHVTEDGLFRGLTALVDLVDTVRGSKALVLFSGGQGPSDRYGPYFRELRDHASLARVSIYPVDCKGLGVPFR